MSGFPDAMRGLHEVVPPADTGTYAVTATGTTNSAANLDLGVEDGGQFITFQPIGGDVFVRFKSSASVAATTTTNGVKIADGTFFRQWVTSSSRYVDHICSAASKKLLWWRSSPNYRTRT